MWRAVPVNEEEVRPFREARHRFDLQPLSVHVSYLINLASSDPIIRRKSIEAFRGELQRAACMGAEYLVTHPGNHKTCSADEGIAGFVVGLKEAACDLDLGQLTVLIENTVGAGAQLGGKLAELRNIRDLAERVCDVRVGYCLDTCHLHAAGFDLATPAGLENTAIAVERELGMSYVKLIHANDSKGALGSHLDRHANIGWGTIGREGFRGILQHPAFRPKPFILETPADDEEEHRRDIETLKELAVLTSDRANQTKKADRLKNNAGKGLQLPRNRK